MNIEDLIKEHNPFPDAETITKEIGTLENKKLDLRDMINGCLNRISITNDESEETSKAYYVNAYTVEYVNTCKKLKYLYNLLNNNFYKR